MLNRSARSGPEKLRPAIEAISGRVHQHATSLSKRLSLLDNWLCQLPGKTETELWMPMPEQGGDLAIGLLLHRANKKWLISYDVRREESDARNADEWKPLADAPIEVKLLVVRLLPPFLERINERLQELADKLEAAHVDFDELVPDIGAMAERGA